MAKRPQVGETVVVEVSAQVVEVTDRYGLSIKVRLPKGDYLYPRTIWLEPSEIRDVKEVQHGS